MTGMIKKSEAKTSITFVCPTLAADLPIWMAVGTIRAQLSL
jgi:hypothetical protein